MPALEVHIGITCRSASSIRMPARVAAPVATAHQRPSIRRKVTSSCSVMITPRCQHHQANQPSTTTASTSTTATRTPRSNRTSS
jgi:hypothetical protein